jgi:hypothetical protein
MNNNKQKKEETRIGVMVFDLNSELEPWEIETPFYFLNEVDFYIVGIDNSRKNKEKENKKNNQIIYIIEKIKHLSNKKFYIMLKNEENDEIVQKLYEIQNIRIINFTTPIIDILDHVYYKKIIVTKPIAKKTFRYKYISSNPELSLLYQLKKIDIELKNTIAVILFYNDFVFCLNPRNINVPYVVIPYINNRTIEIPPGFDGFTKITIDKTGVETVEIYNLNKIREKINKTTINKLKNKIEKKILKYVLETHKDSLITVGKIGHSISTPKEKVLKFIQNISGAINDISFEIYNNDIIKIKTYRKLEDINLSNDIEEEYVVMGCTHFGSNLSPKIIKLLKDEIKTTGDLYVAGDIVENIKYITDLNKPELEQQLKQAKNFFNQLLKINNKLEIVIIPGNHDGMSIQKMYKDYQKIFLNNKTINNLLSLSGIKLKTFKLQILQIIQNYDYLILKNILNNPNIKLCKNPTIINNKLIIHPHNAASQTSSLRLQQIIQTFSSSSKNNFDTVIIANYHQMISLIQKWGKKNYIGISTGTFKSKSRFELLKALKIHDIGFWKVQRRRYSIIFKAKIIKTNPF